MASHGSTQPAARLDFLAVLEPQLTHGLDDRRLGPVGVFETERLQVTIAAVLVRWQRAVCEEIHDRLGERA